MLAYDLNDGKNLNSCFYIKFNMILKYRTFDKPQKTRLAEIKYVSSKKFYLWVIKIKLLFKRCAVFKTSSTISSNFGPSERPKFIFSISSKISAFFSCDQIGLKCNINRFFAIIIFYYLSKMRLIQNGQIFLVNNGRGICILFIVLLLI